MAKTIADFKIARASRAVAAERTSNHARPRRDHRQVPRVLRRRQRQRLRGLRQHRGRIQSHQEGLPPQDPRGASRQGRRRGNFPRGQRVLRGAARLLRQEEGRLLRRREGHARGFRPRGDGLRGRRGRRGRLQELGLLLRGLELGRADLPRRARLVRPVDVRQDERKHPQGRGPRRLHERGERVLRPLEHPRGLARAEPRLGGPARRRRRRGLRGRARAHERGHALRRVGAQRRGPRGVRGPLHGQVDLGEAHEAPRAAAGGRRRRRPRPRRAPAASRAASTAAGRGPRTPSRPTASRARPAS